MDNAIPRNDYIRLLYEQAAREQRELAARVADFERPAAMLEKLARPMVAPSP